MMRPLFIFIIHFITIILSSNLDQNCEKICQNPSESQSIQCQCPQIQRRNLKFSEQGYAGQGFSYDSELVTNQKCFNVRELTIINSSSIAQLSEHLSYQDLEYHFTKTVVHRYCWFFKSTHTYFQDIVDKDYQLSLNFYVATTRTVAVQIDGYAEKCLTDQGKNLYFNTEYFGLQCGDEYITEYEEGALLMMSIVVHFNSIYDKQNFEDSFSDKLGNIVNTYSNLIKQTADSTYGYLKFSIKAFQVGGETQQLFSKFNTQDQQGKYPSMQCDIYDYENCIQTVNNLANYTMYDFPEQLKQNSPNGYVPLGQSFIKSSPVKYLGLKKAKSMVDPQVIAQRLYLRKELDKNLYFEEKLFPLKFNYPFDFQPDIQNSLDTLYSKVQANLKVLISSDIPRLGFQGCYEYPENCNEITQEIKNQIQQIQKSEFDFVEDLKITMLIPPDQEFSQVFPIGNGLGNAKIVYPLDKINSISFSNNYYAYDIQYLAADNSTQIHETATLNLDSNNYFVGQKQTDGGAAVNIGPFTPSESPYYFTVDEKYFDDSYYLYE